MKDKLDNKINDKWMKRTKKNIMVFNIFRKIKKS